MIKRVIFDVDDTLINFPYIYEEKTKEILTKHGVELESGSLYEAVGKYETVSKNKYYDKDKLLYIINKSLNLNLTNKFIVDFFEMYDKLITPLEDGVVETLEYLKDKYELVVLSNWFTDSQKSRLKEAGILEYFDEVYGTDIIPMKPSCECFLRVIGDLKPEECVMVGDSIDADIKVPYEMGMNVFHLNKYGTSKYPTIKAIKDLKERL